MACPLCDDTGWKTIEVDGVSRVDALRLRPREDRSSSVFATRGFRRAISSCTLDNFLTYQNEELLRAVESARRFAERFPVVQKGLMLTARPASARRTSPSPCCGRSSTHRRARALLRHTRAAAGHPQHLRSGDPHRGDGRHPAGDGGGAAGARRPGRRAAHRVGRGDDEPDRQHPLQRATATIFTSNYEDNPDETEPDSLLVRIGFRLRSRLHEMCEFLEYDGADYRNLPPNGGVDDLLQAVEGAAAPQAARPAPRARRAPRSSAETGEGRLEVVGGPSGS